MADDLALLRRWIEQWRETGAVLAELRREELARMSEEEALVIADRVLSLFDPARTASRRSTSGLVDQQLLFAPLRPR